MPCTLFSLLMLILFASISYYARSCGFEVQLKPEPLEIKYTIPTQVQTEGEEAPQITVKVTIEAEEKGQYTYKDKKLTFVIKATQVEVEGEPLENFSVTTFSFDMVKK